MYTEQIIRWPMNNNRQVKLSEGKIRRAIDRYKLGEGTLTPIDLYSIRFLMKSNMPRRILDCKPTHISPYIKSLAKTDNLDNCTDFYDMAFLYIADYTEKLWTRVKEHTDCVIVFAPNGNKVNGRFDDWHMYPFEKSKNLLLFERPSDMPDATEADSPVITFVTRTCCRPKSLEKCVNSVKAQTSNNWHHVFVEDKGRKGMNFANEMLGFKRNVERVHGRFVMVLDDDGWIADETFVERLEKLDKAIEVVMIRSKQRTKLYPMREHWGPGYKRPLYGRIDSPSTIACLDLYKQHIHKFARYAAGDFFYISAVFATSPKIYWMDRVIAMTSGRHHGVREKEGRPL
jgi:hypothetical protein